MTPLHTIYSSAEKENPIMTEKTEAVNTTYINISNDPILQVDIIRMGKSSDFSQTMVITGMTRAPDDNILSCRLITDFTSVPHLPIVFNINKDEDYDVAIAEGTADIYIKSAFNALLSFDNTRPDGYDPLRLQLAQWLLDNTLINVEPDLYIHGGALVSPNGLIGFGGYTTVRRYQIVNGVLRIVLTKQEIHVNSNVTQITKIPGKQHRMVSTGHCEHDMPPQPGYGFGAGVIPNVPQPLNPYAIPSAPQPLGYGMVPNWSHPFGAAYDCGNSDEKQHQQQLKTKWYHQLVQCVQSNALYYPLMILADMGENNYANDVNLKQLTQHAADYIDPTYENTIDYLKNIINYLKGDLGL